MEFIGHRGARFEAPENTLSGFRYALGLGINRFETDMRLTNDGEIAIIHDQTVDRTTNGAGDVADFTLDELRHLDARAIFPEWPEAARIPSLADMLELMRDVKHLELEVKDSTSERIERAIARAVEILREFRMTDVAMFTSSHEYALEVARAVAPEIRRGLFGHFTNAQKRADAERFGASMVGFTYGVEQAAEVEWAHRAGIRIHGGPTNDEAAVREALSWPADAIYTDAPTAIRQMLESFGVSIAR